MGFFRSILLFSLLLVASQAEAATFVVTKTADTADGVCDADCSLREAVQEANNVFGNHLITLPAGRYVLTLGGPNENNNQTGDLDINVNGLLAIQGASASSTSIDGGFRIIGNPDRVFHIVFGTVVFADVTIQNGSADSGGGIRNDSLGLLLLQNSTVQNNRALSIGGGIFSSSTDPDAVTRIQDSIVRGNTLSFGSGGGVSCNGNLFIFGSTITGNRAQFGIGAGGISALGSALFIDNSTISANVMSGNGTGGIFSSAAQTRLKHVTVTGNSSGLTSGIRTQSSFTATAVNSILSGNTGGGDCGGDISSLGHNIAGISCGFSAPGDLSGVNPLLGALQNNGGFTPTQALLEGSPAIDAADPASCLATDQRGAARPADGDEDGVFLCDIGAYELFIICGNGFPEGPEECDDGNLTSGDGCDAACILEPPPPPVCGNGITEIGETCDDGNTTSGDGCSATCFVEVPPPVCGNGIQDLGEVCDDGNTSNLDICLNTCTAASCGDGFIRFGVEQCDDGNNASGDGCNSACLTEVILPPVPVCGNGIVEVGETCDDGNLTNSDGCSSICVVEVPVTPPASSPPPSTSGDPSSPSPSVPTPAVGPAMRAQGGGGGCSLIP